MPTPADLDAWIRAHWDDTLRQSPKDDGSLLALARPYTVPCADGMFQELYYWDTYYTCEGLIAHGRVALAKDNAECLLGMVDRFGFVPNGNRSYYVTRSQPPHLALMVSRIHAVTGDDAWLAAALPRIEREVAFWRTLRSSPCGLATYGVHGTDGDAQGTTEWVHQNRFPITQPREAWVDIGRDLTASCESGWDFTPRFGFDCRSICPVDLNCLLAATEDLVGLWRERLGLPAALAWRAAAAARRARVDELCWDEASGTWLDWDWRRGERRMMPSAAAAYALWLGAESPERARRWAAQALPRLLFKGGITTCEPGPRSQTWQWDHPNAWPPLQYAAVMGLLRHGLEAEARQIAKAWCQAAFNAWVATGRLWEKSNCVTGGLDVKDEYPMPPMLGWTAGTWAHLHHLKLDA